MNKKLLWEDIFQDFQRRFPNLKKEVLFWRPAGMAMIAIYFGNQRYMLYDYDRHTGRFVKREAVESELPRRRYINT